MNPINKRLIEAYQKSGLSFPELERITGIPKSSLQRYITGGFEGLPMPRLEKIAEALNVSASYIMGWSDEDYYQYENISPMPKFNKVPLIGAIACGTPILAQENIEDMIPLPDYVKADFCLTCKGDSMVGAHIFDGDIVFIRKQPDVENNEIAAVVLSGEATLKRVRKHANMIQLKAENPDFDDIFITKENLAELKIIGKAVHFLSRVK